MMIAEERAIAVTENGWRSSPEYGRAMECLQNAQWDEAATVLKGLLAGHPDEPALQALAAEVQVRLETERRQHVQARRLRLPGRRFVFAAVLLAVLAGLVWAAQSFYVGMIVPSLAQARAAKNQEAVAGQAAQALAAGDYTRALDLYGDLAALNPNHPALAGGMAQARQALSLEADYRQAQQQLADGKLTEAQATLVKIQEVAPTYRDVGVLLTKIERRQRLAGILRQANDAITAADWETAVNALQEARTISPEEDRSSIEADLFDAYLALGSQIIKGCQGQPSEVQRAAGYFAQALALRPQEPHARTQQEWAQAYLAGYAAFAGGQWADAVTWLEPLYAQQPAYLNGKIAQLLYDAYVRQGNLYAQDEKTTTQAWEQYTSAGKIQGVDTTTARALAAHLAAAITPTPVPSPTPTRLPTPTPLPAVAAAPAQPPSRQVGRILYWSERGGPAELWVMDADGKNAARVPDQAQAKSDYDRLRAAELSSPDGSGALVVVQPQGQSNPQVIAHYQNGTDRQVVRLEGSCYDPVWSPTGHWIAFVSNAMGNDEVFVVGEDGTNLKRLTENQWEWDKHPSWSPDGKRLVFWSNRAVGRAQIWVMNADGSGQANLSRNGFSDRDPVWIK